VAETRFTPSVQPMMQDNSPAPTSSVSGGLALGGGFAEMVSFMREERDDMEARLEARLEAKEAEMEAKIAKLTAPEPEAITDEDLVTLQARLEGLHASKLITDEVRRSDCRGLLLSLLVVHPICILLLAATLQWSRLL
jgi:hypothetical protein